MTVNRERKVIAMSSGGLQRFEGRLFAEGGCLFMVVSTNEAAQTARVSCGLDGHTQVIEMPLPEVAKRISSSSGLMLDNLNGPDSARRLLKQRDGWYFSTREGLMGPYPTEKAAGRDLGRYILSMQTEGPRPGPATTRPRGPTNGPRRRVSDVGQRAGTGV